MQFGAVDHGLGLVALEHGGRHQRTGIDDHRALADQPLALDRDQFRVAGAGTDEVHRHGKSLQEREAKWSAGQGEGRRAQYLAGQQQPGCAPGLLAGQGQRRALGHAPAAAVGMGCGRAVAEQRLKGL
ncbi:hypothetical protein D3C76_1221670 [compost metagenome]